MTKGQRKGKRKRKGSLFQGVAMFEFEKLIVFQRAMEAAEVIKRMLRSLPPSEFALRDQIYRATMSVVLNISEGAGEFSRPEKARFYRMARRSALEAAGGIMLAHRWGFFLAADVAQSKRLLAEVASMLTAMCKPKPSRR